jgi:CRISPR-associated protein Csx17
MTEPIRLDGCSPIPLASYLKALGVFRLVAEQKDKNVRGFWRDEAFVLDTGSAEEDLLQFFLRDYSPSPIISPWRAGSGFYFREGKRKEKDPATGKRIKTGVRDEATAATKTLDRIANARADRFNSLRGIINQVRSAIKQRGYQQAPADDKKQELITLLRRSLSDDALEWLDAAMALSTKALLQPPLLGTGGNDGNLDFSSNYMQRLADLFDFTSGKPLPAASAMLGNSLFGTPVPNLSKAILGQYAPATTGGPNATVGFEPSDTLVRANSWDYVLMLEGTLLFAGSASKRLQAADAGGLSYPFTVSATNTDGASGALYDEKRVDSTSKRLRDAYEVWMPLWCKPATFYEIRMLMSEGRATINRRPARDGLDFSRAIGSLGVDRGIDSFQRFALLQRRGASMSGTPKGRFHVRLRPEGRLLDELEAGNWLLRFRQYARRLDRERKKFEAPHRVQVLALRLDEAIFTMSQNVTPSSVQQVLITIGDATTYLASAPKARDPGEGNQRPPPRLSQAWFHAANDGTAEFRIAAALAGLGRAPQKEGEVEPDQETAAESERETAVDEEANGVEDEAVVQPLGDDEERVKKIPPPPFRAHLAPLDEKSWYARRHSWSERDRLSVWGAGTLRRNLTAVLQRRLLFAAQRNLAGGPFDGRAPADLASVLAFLAGDADDAKIAALARGLAWVEPPDRIRTEPDDLPPLPLPYALLKPFFASVDQVQKIVQKHGASTEGAALRVPPALVTRLQAGDVGAAVALAARGAQASGLPVTFKPHAEHVEGSDGRRLLAALLVPIRTVDLERILHRAYPALFDDTEAAETEEETADAA